MTERLILVDGSQYAHRAFHATKKKVIYHSYTKKPTNVLRCFYSMLNSLLNRTDAMYVAVLMDKDRNTHRRQLFPQYKANRLALDPVLAAQMPHIPELCDALGVKCVSMAGFEADDLIASYAIAWDGPVLIVSNDKDMMQLVRDGHVEQFDPTPERQKLYREGDVRDKWGVWPEQIPDLLAIMGDTIDGFPGVPGIGPIYATALIQQHHSVEELLNHLDVGGEVIPAFARDVILKHRKEVELYKTLATLHMEVPTPTKVYELRREFDPQKLRAFCADWEFRDIELRLEAMEGLSW